MTHTDPTRFSLLSSLPTELQAQVVFHLNQEDLVNVSLVCKHLHEVAVDALYRRIYLNDSKVEKSNEYNLAPNWSYLQIVTVNRTGQEPSEANEKLGQLVRSVEENPRLVRSTTEVRMNWDLDMTFQKRFLELLTKHSRGLRIIENITNTILSEALEDCEHSENIVSLDLPPPSTKMTHFLPDEYIPNTRRLLKKKLGQTIRHLTLFMDPVIMFNNVVRLERKLELVSLKLHCRYDIFCVALYRTHNRTRHDLTEMFDVQSLKALTVISWFNDNLLPDDNVLKYDEWAKFTNLEDLTMIAVPCVDVKVAHMIESFKRLRRLKLDFINATTITKYSRVYNAILKQSEHLEFLDFKMKQTYNVMDIDPTRRWIIFSCPCSCRSCQACLSQVMKKKILNHSTDYMIRDGSMNTYHRANVFDASRLSGLYPYSKAVDKFPSVKTEPGDIEDFLERFNKQNEERRGFVPLDKDDFYLIYNCFIHSLKSDMEPFVEQCTKLKFFVMNDVSFVMREHNGQRYPFPLFYADRFQSNFYAEPEDQAMNPKSPATVNESPSSSFAVYADNPPPGYGLY